MGIKAPKRALPVVFAFMWLILIVSQLQAQPQALSLDQLPNLIRVPLVRQGTDYTCGVAAFHSVLGYYGQDIRDDKLIRAMRVTRAGANYRFILKEAARLGYNARMFTDMTLEGLQALLDQGKPTILIIQAWADPPVDYAKDWKDGHYVVAVGYDADNVYFMDPSTLGNYTFIPVAEFLERWHDRDDWRRQNLNHCAIVIDGKPPVYDPNAIKRLE